MPVFSARLPYAVPPQSGVALRWTSPALLLALFVRRPLPLVVSLWCSTVLDGARGRSVADVLRERFNPAT